jgi:hypothetical protein
MLANGEPLPEKVAGAIYEEPMTKTLLIAHWIAGQYRKMTADAAGSRISVQSQGHSALAQWVFPRGGCRVSVQLSMIPNWQNPIPCTGGARSLPAAPRASGPRTTMVRGRFGLRRLCLHSAGGR